MPGGHQLVAREARAHHGLQPIGSARTGTRGVVDADRTIERGEVPKRDPVTRVTPNFPGARWHGDLTGRDGGTVAYSDPRRARAAVGHEPTGIYTLPRAIIDRHPIVVVLVWRAGEGIAPTEVRMHPDGVAAT